MFGLCVEVGDGGEEAASDAGGDATEQGLRVLWAAVKAECAGEGVFAGAFGGELMGGEPISDGVAHAADDAVDGVGVGGEGVMPEGHGLVGVAEGGLVHGGEDDFFAAAADEVGDVLVCDFGAVGDVEAELIYLVSEEGGIGFDKIDKPGGCFGAELLAAFGGGLNNEPGQLFWLGLVARCYFADGFGLFGEALVGGEAAAFEDEGR